MRPKQFRHFLIMLMLMLMLLISHVIKIKIKSKSKIKIKSKSKIKSRIKIKIRNWVGVCWSAKWTGLLRSEVRRGASAAKQFRHIWPGLLHGLVKRCAARDGLASGSSGADDLGV